MTETLRLTEQEERVMRAFWQNDIHSVKEVLNHLEEPIPPYTTIASIVGNLESKGYLKGEKKGRRYEYTIIHSAEDYSQQTVGKLIDNGLTAGYKDLVQQFISSNKLSREELKEIIELIEKG